MSANSHLFPATRWTLVERLRKGTAEEVRAALETLCRAYWQPLYCVARQKTASVHDAQDSVQGFFETVLRRDTLSSADPALGKLRQFMLRSFDNYCSQQWHKARRQKRGGGVEHLEFSELLDVGQAEQRYVKFAAENTSVETLYNRAWASALMERSLQILREDYAKRGWQERYDLLVGPLLQTEDEASLAQIAVGAGMTAGALRVTLHRMRGHYRDKIERELAVTLDTDDPQLIREEMIELFKAFT